jgi:hypothetical protein
MVNGQWSMVNSYLNFELRYYFRTAYSPVLLTIDHKYHSDFFKRNYHILKRLPEYCYAMY